MKTSSKLLVALAAMALSRVAAAQVPCDGTGTVPCGFQIQAVALQPVPPTMHFQARVSQAQLPVGSGTFPQVFVNIKRDNATLCTEEFDNVLVTQSVVNLEIGRNMTCALDQVVAANADLQFQLCIGQQNCLAPVQFGTAPYAMKATYAMQAQQAYQADVAGQANYTHRATADVDLFQTLALGKGYLDFTTPTSGGNVSMLTTNWSTYMSGGFIQWAPLIQTNPTLTIGWANQATQQLDYLNQLVLAATTTELTGGLAVAQTATIAGQTTISGPTYINSPLHVTNSSGNALLVTGNSQLTGTLGAGATTVNGTLNVIGNSTLGGSLGVGNTAVTGTLMTSGATTVAGLLTAQGNENVTGTLTAGNIIVPQGGTVSFPSGSVSFSGTNSDFAVKGSLSVQGGGETCPASTINDGVKIDTLVSTGSLTASGSTTFSGQVTISQTATLAEYPSLNVQGTASFSQPVAMTGLTVSGSASFSNQVSFAGGLSVTGATSTTTLSISSASATALTVTGGAVIGGALSVTGTTSVSKLLLACNTPSSCYGGVQNGVVGVTTSATFCPANSYMCGLKADNNNGTTTLYCCPF